MQVSVIGANHTTMPVELRERLAVSAEQLPDVLSALLERVPQAVLLSTCNRTEIYTLDQEGTVNADAAADFLCAHAGLGPDALAPYLYTHAGDEAVRHLFRVACGLDSMIIGEHEILGQVSHAYEAASLTGRLGLAMGNLFREAIRTGRRVRAETQLARHALSVGSVAVDLATKAVADIGRCHVLVIGAGEAGRLVARAVAARGTPQITVTNRSLDRASALAESLGGRTAPFEAMQDALVDADVVIACTGAPHTILYARAVEAAMRARPDRPMVIIDISVPRNVDPEAARAGNVFLYDIDDLTRITEANAQLRRAEVDRVTAIMNAEIERYLAWASSMRVKPTVSALVQKAEAIRQAQWEMTVKKLPNLSPAELEDLESMTRAIVKRVLHDPIRCLKRECGECGREACHDNELHVQVVSEIFRLGDEVPEPEEARVR